MKVSPADSANREFLPNFCEIRTIFLVVLVAELFALMLSLAGLETRSQFWERWGLNSLFVVWTALLTAAICCRLRLRLNRIKPRRAALFVIVLVNLIVIALSLAYPLIFRTTSSDLALALMRRTGIATLAASVWLRYLYMQCQWRRQLAAELDARQDALQARMRPHFLFNGLNTVAALIAVQPELAEELLLDLAEVFRVIIKRDTRLIPLREEVALTRQYLNIEQQRLGPRLRVNWDLGDLPPDALIPPLSLQPLVENAVYHGIEQSAEGGTIDIQGRRRKDELILSVGNPWLETEQDGIRPGNRMARDNLRLRLENAFPDRGQLLTSMVDGRYLVRIVIPYLTAAHADFDRR